MNGPLPYLGYERPEPEDTSSDDLYDMYIQSELGTEIDTQILGDAKYVVDHIFQADFDRLPDNECEGFDRKQGKEGLYQLMHDIVASVKNGDKRLDLTVPDDTAKMLMATLFHVAAMNITEREEEERKQAFCDRFGFDEDIPQ